MLVNPLRTQWFSDRGEAVDPPQVAPSSVSVVADLVEESHVCIKVPGLVGRDRQSFIKRQYQILLPDVPLRGSWLGASRHPVLPRPFEMHAMGVSSPILIERLDELTKANQPIEGVWSLSYLMAHWASRQAMLSGRKWVLLSLGLPHGMRLVLLRNQVPVFTRLLLISDPVFLAQEVSQTLKYLVDHRIIEREARPVIVPMDPAPEFLQGLHDRGLELLPSVVSPHAGGMLAEVMSLARSGAPGNLASLAVRRHHLARRAEFGLRVLMALVVLVGTVGLMVQGRNLVAGVAQSRLQQQQAAEMTQAAQAIRDETAGSNINVPQLRLALAVQQQELQAGVDPVQQMWLLGQLLKDHPQAQLMRTEQTLSEHACSDLQAGSDVASAMSPAISRQVAWQFDVRPGADLSPRQRQALLESLAKVVGAWSGWQVKVNPESQEHVSVLTGGQGANVDATAPDWHWCLASQTDMSEASP